MAGSDRRTQEKVKAYLDERRRLVERWQQEERERWPERARLTPDELDELCWAEHAHDERLRAIARQHFGQGWESGNIRNIKTPAELWAYIVLVAVPVVTACPAAAQSEISTVLNGYAAAGLPTPAEPTWKTPDEALRVLRRLADAVGEPQEATTAPIPETIIGRDAALGDLVRYGRLLKRAIENIPRRDEEERLQPNASQHYLHKIHPSAIDFARCFRVNFPMQYEAWIRQRPDDSMAAALDVLNAILEQAEAADSTSDRLPEDPTARLTYLMSVQAAGATVESVAGLLAAAVDDILMRLEEHQDGSGGDEGIDDPPAGKKNPPAAGAGAKQKKKRRRAPGELNGCMLDMIMQRPDARGWTCQQWATELKAHPPQIVEQPTWKELEQFRAIQKIDQQAAKRRARQGK